MNVGRKGDGHNSTGQGVNKQSFSHHRTNPSDAVGQAFNRVSSTKAIRTDIKHHTLLKSSVRIAPCKGKQQ